MYVYVTSDKFSRLKVNTDGFTDREFININQTSRTDDTDFGNCDESVYQQNITKSPQGQSIKTSL